MRNLLKALSLASLLVCLLCTATNLYAQTDYIINNEGVKHIGTLKKHDLKKVKFITAGEVKARKYKPNEIREAYKTGQGLFRSVSASEGRKANFLEVLEDGKIKLYEYFKRGRGGYGGTIPMAGGGFATVGMGSSTQKTWNAQRDSSELVEVKSNQIWGSRQKRKDRFFQLIQDNEKVVERYQAESKFNFDIVRSLIVEYNSWFKN